MRQAIQAKNDEVYTAEFRNQRVQKFTSERRFLGTFPVQPHAGGVAVDPEGNVHVAHWNSNKVAAYSPFGEHFPHRQAGGRPFTPSCLVPTALEHYGEILRSSVDHVQAR